jgi:hypothetical protein
MTQKTKMEVSEEWFRRVWLEEDTSAIDEILLPETKASGLGSHPHIGPDEFRYFHAGLLGLMEQVIVTSDLHIEQGDWLAQLVTVKGICRKTSHEVTMLGQMMLKIIDGHIVEGHNRFDFISLYEQLGLLPNQTFEDCLAGKVLA